MQISELFVSLGVKGSEKTLGALSSVKSGLGSIASTSLEAKAAIIGAMYALEQFMSESAKQGTNLSNFNALTGISVKQLQQWQYAARQAGESSEEFTGSLKSVYDKMAQMKLNKGAPEGLGLLASTVGFDVKKAYTDTFYVFEQLQKFAHSNVSKDIQNQVFKSFGVSENTISALRKGVFSQQNFKKAPVYGEGEVNQLAKVDVLWGNLEQKVKMLFGHFNAQHGVSLVSDISKITDQVFRMIGAFERLAEKLKIFDKLAEAFKGWEIIFTKLGDLSDKISGSSSSKSDKNETKKTDNIEKGLSKAEGISTFGSFGDSFFKFENNGKQDLHPKEKDPGAIDKITNFIGGLFSSSKGDNSSSVNSLLPDTKSSITPNTVVTNQNPSNTQNTNINQNLYFQHEGKEAPKIKDSIHKSVGDAWKQLSAQSQGT